MNDKLIEIESKLSEPDFFYFLKYLNVDEALDTRDKKEFEDVWIKEYEKIKLHVFPEEEMQLIKKLEEKAFNHSYRELSDADLSGYISDDIGLISKYLLLDLTESWAISFLWEKYKKGELPIVSS